MLIAPIRSGNTKTARTPRSMAAGTNAGHPQAATARSGTSTGPPASTASRLGPSPNVELLVLQADADRLTAPRQRYPRRSGAHAGRDPIYLEDDGRGGERLVGAVAGSPVQQRQDLSSVR